jgi:6-pyruvoyltetrahydropterin/6-carboxytetrahydropterin synthase
VTYTIRKQFKFEAAHQLMDHDGQCARLHGHSWVMWVEVKGAQVHTEGPKRNMLIDFSDVKTAVKPLVDQYLDHHHLNDTLDCDMPTSEYVTAWMFGKVADLIPGLAAVEIEETCTSMCRYET